MCQCKWNPQLFKLLMNVWCITSLTYRHIKAVFTTNLPVTSQTANNIVLIKIPQCGSELPFIYLTRGLSTSKDLQQLTCFHQHGVCSWSQHSSTPTTYKIFFIRTELQWSVFENTVLRRIFWPDSEEVRRKMGITA